jgi:hypothetical protein
MTNVTHADVNRVQEDLAIVKQAMGLHSMHDRPQIWVNVGLAALGLVIGAATAFTGVSSPPAVPGSTSHLLYIALIIFPVGLALVGLAFELRRRKRQAILSSFTYMRTLVAASLAIPVYLGFVAWGLSKGLSGGTITAATFFVVGLLVLLDSLYDARRRYFIGWAIATIVAGFAAPLFKYETAGILAGLWLVCGGLSTATIVAWQTKLSGAADVN